MPNRKVTIKYSYDKSSTLIILSNQSILSQYYLLAIGWEYVYRSFTYTDNDGKIPHDFPDKAGDLRACTSRLVVKANGKFQMSDEHSGQLVSSTRQRDKNGKSIRSFTLVIIASMPAYNNVS